ncbi:MAG: flagellar filament capping protein FliD [Candidatus Thiodiazotropha sp.]
MATISAAGIGSGLDIESIISSLMDVERIPLKNLQVKAGDLLTKVSAYGTLRSALATFQDSASKLASTDSFNFFKATSGDESAYTVTADNSAATGSYSISVDSLAAAHKLGSTTSIANSSTLVGNTGDQMTITIGTESFTVDIGAHSLSSIQDLINEATDNVGVSAGIVQESDSSVHLVLTSDNTGLANQISVSFTDSLGGAIADPLGMTQIQAADDAQITIDNTYVISRSSNTISDAIEGVTFDLQGVSASASQMNVSRDSGAISSAVKSLVDSYNNLLSSFSDLQNGDLKGDGTLRLIENQLRTVMGGKAGVDGAFKYASQIGITFERDGTLSFDSTELTNALATDRTAVMDLFTNTDQGLATQMDSLVENMLSSTGLIHAREDGINARVDNTNDQIDRMNYRLTKIEQRYRAQYSALDTMLGEMQSTSAWLTGQLDSLTNMISNKNGK